MRLRNFIHGLFLLQKDNLRRYLRPAYEKQYRELTEKRKQFYSTFLLPGALVFDVGANLGNRVEPIVLYGSNVVAFEPQLTCFYYLKLKFGNRIVARNLALGEAVSEKEIILNKDSSTIATMSDHWMKEVGEVRFGNSRWGKRQAVKVDTLQNQIKLFGLPHFVKIDVEGYEEQVLKGLQTPVPILSFEYTTPEMGASALNCLQIIHTLSPAYEFNFVVTENTWFELKNWLNLEEFRSLILHQIDTLKGFGDIYARLKK